MVEARAKEGALPGPGRIAARPVPYDLRHAAASLWFNAGVPPTEITRPLGHSVAVLLKVYANCVDGGEEGTNERIGTALG